MDGQSPTQPYIHTHQPPQPQTNRPASRSSSLPSRSPSGSGTSAPTSSPLRTTASPPPVSREKRWGRTATRRKRKNRPPLTTPTRQPTPTNSNTGKDDILAPAGVAASAYEVTELPSSTPSAPAAPAATLGYVCLCVYAWDGWGDAVGWGVAFVALFGGSLSSWVHGTQQGGEQGGGRVYQCGRLKRAALSAASGPT